MATMSSPDSDDPLGIGRKLGFHRSGGGVVTQHSHHHNNHHHHHHQQQQQQRSLFQQQQLQPRCPHIVISDASAAVNGSASPVKQTPSSSSSGKTPAATHGGHGHGGHHHHNHHHHHHSHNHHHASGGSSSGTTTNNNQADLLLAKVKMKAAVDPLAHKHVEENIETFLESFKHKTWSVDAAASASGRDGGMTLLDTRRTSCSDSGDYDDADDNSSTTTNTTDSHCWTSSVISTADDLSTDSPGDGPALLTGSSGPGAALSGSAAAAGAVGGLGGSRKHPSTLEYESGSAGRAWRERDSIIAESRRIARWAWRQSNFTGSQDTPCSCSYHPPHPLVYDVESEYVIIESEHEEPPGSAMDEASQQYKVMDVAPLLQTRYAILSGGKAKNGAPIITFPARPGQTDVSDEDYGKVVTYLCGITPLHESESGFVVVIDRRQDGWGLVKSILLKLSAFFPVHIQVVFLLQPKGFFQRAFADFRSKFVKEELEFKVILCDSPKDIEEWVDLGQLTSDVGGELEFDAHEWTEHRSAVEKFSKNTAQISTNLSAVVKKMEERELPNEVGGTQTLIRMCQAERKELLEDIDSASAHGDTLLKCIRGECESTPLTKLCHVLELERLLVQLDESRTGFGEFWARHETKLQQCLVVREFEEEFKLLQFTMERRQEELQNTMDDLGESVPQVEALLKDFDAMEEESQNDIDKTERMRTRGKQLMMDEHYAVDSIRPKCVELQRMCEQYKELLRKRREMLTKSHDLQDRLDRANKWCSSGVDMLANHPVDRQQTTQGAQQALQDIDAYLATARELKLSNPREFRQLFESMMTAETRANVANILKRMEDVQGMCAKRKESLRPIVGPSKTRPVQQVNPEPTATTARDPSPHQPGRPDAKKPVIHAEKSARFRPEIQHHTSSLSDNGISNTSQASSDLSFNLSHASSGSQSTSDTSSSVVSSDTQRSSVSSVSMSSFPEGDSAKSKQKHIMNELIETEEAYVNELYQILQGYYNKMDDRSLLMMIPPALQGQKHILFGNLDDLYIFHNNLFLNELKQCRESPARVGKIFVNRKEEFQMYSIYCQNKPKSEALRIRVGDSNPFFKECQRQLGHRLPLGAYLLKPIQRITKYQLLLKEMLKNTGDNPDLTAALNEALDTMLSVLAYLNDSMHQVAISGYSGNLSDLGRLLLHGSFRVWTEHKHEKLRDLRLRPMQRHVFLYQRDMLFCKQKEGEENQPSYTFKTKINLSQVGLTEKIKGDKRKFELWLRAREEVYIIQAPDMATKDVWIKEIKRVLLSQFDHLKANRQMLSGTAHGSQISSGSDYSLDNWRSSGDEGDVGRGNNNNSKSSSLTRNVPPTISEPYPYYQGEEGEGLGTGGAGDRDDSYDDEGGWSSGEFSNTDDEQLAEQYIPKIEPSYREHFVSLGDYYPIDSTELGLTEGDEVEVQRVGTNGWWYARHVATGGQGWVPSTYLEPISRQGQGQGVSSSNSEGNLFSSSDSLCVAGAKGDMPRSASGRHYYRSNSPVPETTV